MRLQPHGPIRLFVLTATATMIATTVALALGARVGLAADFQEGKNNVCEGNLEPASDCAWATHITTGEDNVALGDEMMSLLTSGSDNVALDFGALENNTTGGGNVANGVDALRFNTAGNNNIATGGDADAFNTTGENNIASGSDALEANKTGGNNIVSGTNALIVSTGSANVAFGTGAGENLTTGSNNIYISNNAGAAVEERTIRIGTTVNPVATDPTRAFIAGIYKKTIKTPVCTVKVNEAGQLGCVASKTGPSGVNSEESPALIAQFSRQQHEIDQLANELKSLREQTQTHR